MELFNHHDLHIAHGIVMHSCILNYFCKDEMWLQGHMVSKFFFWVDCSHCTYNFLLKKERVSIDIHTLNQTSTENGITFGGPIEMDRRGL